MSAAVSDLEWALREAIRTTFDEARRLAETSDEVIRQAAKRIDMEDEFTDWLAERED